MPTAHLIHGYLGAGKTTFARQLEVELPAIRFTHDEWTSRLYGDDPPFELFASYHRKVWALMQETWVRCLTLGLDVVVDMNFWRRADRDAARSAIATISADYKLYELKCTESDAWRRIDARNNDLKGSLLITRATFDFLKDRFEPLGDDEDRVTISS